MNLKERTGSVGVVGMGEGGGGFSSFRVRRRLLLPSVL